MRYAKSPIRNMSAYEKKLAITQEYLRPDSNVLEFGCGTGSTAILHVRDMVAIDISDKMLEIAEQKARDAGIENITFRRGSLEEVDLAKASFDAVLGLNILHLLEDLDATLARAGFFIEREWQPGKAMVFIVARKGE